MDNISKLHGMPHYIVYDKEPTIIDNFWQELLGSKETNCISSLPIIPIMMAKMKLSTSVWEHI
jgi:hypothetical protein